MALIKNLLFQLTVRLLVLVPVIVGYFQGYFQLPLVSVSAVVMILALSALLYLLLALPLRFHSRGHMMRYVKGHQPPQKVPYGLWLKLALSRFGRAFFWLLPAFICMVGLYYLWNIADATQLVKVIRFLASLVGGSYLHGTLMLMAIFLLSLPLAYIGWRRHLALEYLPRELLENKPFEANHQWMQASKSALTSATFKNFLICLPTVLAVLGILYMDMAPKMRGSMTGDLLIILETVNKLAFSANAFMQLGAALVVFYLPFVQYRKLALAAALMDNHA